MNEKQSQELQELTNLEAAGTLEESQKDRLEELKTFKGLAEKTADLDKKSKDLESALAQKDHFREKFDKAEADRKALEEKLGKASPGKTGLDVGDYINISASLEGLTQREKEKLASEHKLTGKPIQEIRNSEDFTLWQSALKQKVEKDAASLPPSSKQPDDNSPISLDEALSGAKTMEEKEALLAETMGYTIGNKPRADRVVIGR
jgi:hypothetical protein